MPSKKKTVSCPVCKGENVASSNFCRYCGRALHTPDSIETEAAPNSDSASAAAIDASRARKLLDRALQLSQRGELPAAVLACRQAIALDHDSFDAYATLGALLERQRDFRGAIAAFERALVLTPDSAFERDSLERLRAEHAQTNDAPFQFDQDELTLSAENEGASLAETSEAETPAETADNFGIGVRLPPTSQELAALEAAQAHKDAGASTGEKSAADAGFAGVTAIALAAAQARAAEEARYGAGAQLPPVSSSVPSLVPIPNDNISSLENLIVEPALAEARPMAQSPVAAPVLKSNAAPGIASAKPGAHSDPRLTPVVPIANRPATPRGSNATRAGASSQSGVPAGFQFALDAAPALPLWAQMVRGQSFFARTLPLLGVAVVSLGFLSWARGRAVSLQNAQPTVSVGATNPTVNAGNGGANPAATPNFVVVPEANSAGAPTQSGFTITNGAQPTPQAGAAAAPTAIASIASVPSGANVQNPRVASRPANGNRTPNRAIPTGVTQIAPAQVPPAPSRSGSNPNFDLRPPRLDSAPPAAPRIQVLPPSAPAPSVGASSSGGAPVNPAGAPNAERGYIRVTQGSIPPAGAPARSENRNTASERGAANDARAGRTDRAIDGFTSAINRNAPNAGYLYQQRAMAFLQRGDNGRAAEDFQSSINSYQDQINRGGADADDAKAGLRAARSGLNVALSARQ